MSAKRPYAKTPKYLLDREADRVKRRIDYLTHTTFGISGKLELARLQAQWLSLSAELDARKQEKRAKKQDTPRDAR